MPGPENAAEERWEEFCEAVDQRFGRIPPYEISDIDGLGPGYVMGECSGVIRLGADFADPYVVRGSAHLRKGRYDEAIADLDQAIQLGPENGAAYLRRGCVYTRLAAQCEGRRVACSAYCERGRAYFLEHDHGKAIADFNYAIRLDPEDGHWVWRSCLRYRRAAYRKYALRNMGEAPCDEVIKYWSEAIHLDPAFDRTWAGLGPRAEDSLASAYGIRASEHIDKREYDKAIVDCFNTVRIDLLREEAEKRRDVGQAAGEDDEDEDEDEVEYLDDEDEDWQDDEDKDDEEWENEEEWEDEVETVEFMEAVWLNREHPEADFYRWLSWLCGGQYDEAIADLDKAVRLAPEDAAVHVCRAIVRISKGDFNAAIKDLDEAVRHDPRDATAHFCRGIAYGGKGRYDEAVADLEKSIEFDRRDGAANCCRAIARLGKARAQADADFEEAKRRGYPATWWKPASAATVPAVTEDTATPAVDNAAVLALAKKLGIDLSILS